jgi:hypothetical protein
VDIHACASGVRSKKRGRPVSKVEQSEIIGFACATTITTIYYLTTKALGPQAATRHIQSLLSLFVIAPVNRVVLD